MKKNEFKILVAEDDDIVRDLVVKFLSDEGYSVAVVNDGLEAVKMLRLEDFKLVLSDLRMPGADGMEVLRAAMRIDPGIAVVIITAYGTLDTALEAMNEGAYDYIVKPFVMQQLLLAVRNAFNMAVLTEENDNLAFQLKETYRTLEACKMAGTRESPDAEETGSTDAHDREVDEDNSENIKKYNSLINELKIK
ncbi:MAG: response regulator [Nitrospiraceae bacterium]|nr:MAG: response regulator [Nitrospiraceae bacterium]